MLRTPRFVPVLAFLAAGALACDSDSTDEGGDTVIIEMQDNEFSPATRTIDTGTTVRWVNEGANTHNTTSATQVWQSANLSPGQSFDQTFNAAGTFEYECTLHEGMTGTITVN